MPVCEVCGNDYDKTIEVSASGETHTFDSFECAIHALAPHCAHCDCRIVGHGVEVGGPCTAVLTARVPGASPGSSIEHEVPPSPFASARLRPRR